MQALPAVRRAPAPTAPRRAAPALRTGAGAARSERPHVGRGGCRCRVAHAGHRDRAAIAEGRPALCPCAVGARCRPRRTATHYDGGAILIVVHFSVPVDTARTGRGAPAGPGRYWRSCEQADLRDVRAWADGACRGCDDDDRQQEGESAEEASRWRPWRVDAHRERACTGGRWSQIQISSLRSRTRSRRPWPTSGTLGAAIVR